MHERFETPSRRVARRGGIGVLFVILSLSALTTLPQGSAAKDVLAAPGVDGTIWSDSFETTFPSTTWTVGDADPSSGVDTWGTTSYRAEAGAMSAWVAASGNRSAPATALSDDFEGATAGSDWAVNDADPNAGSDYWGLSDAMAYSGTYSFWSAQYGMNSEYGDAYSNVEVGSYDDSMNTTMVHSVDLTGYATATLDFAYWMDIEPGYDYFYVAYFDGGWNYINQLGGSSGGWTTASVSIPVSATMVGFLFTSDESTIYPGVYVDSITVSGNQFQLNSDAHLYDDGMDATMSRAVTISGYQSARIDYSFWADTQVGSDYLEVGYFTDMWHYTQRQEGSSGGWRAATVDIPLDSTRVGFRFVSDGSGRAEGVYIDDVRVVGHVDPVTCGAAVTPTSGIEGSTNFFFSLSVAGGFRPFTWFWDFGDGRNATVPSPEHVIDQVGTFAPVLTVRDALGQSCQATAPSVTIAHDLSAIVMAPPSATVSEGGSLTVGAFDNRGHALDFAWSVDPVACGSVAVDGSAATFVSTRDAGGLTCILRATYSGAVGISTVTVVHDLSAPSLVPGTATVVERGTVDFGAFDTNGHAAAATWSASCGRVSPSSGPTTTFSAVTNGGNACTVTAQVAQTTVTALVTILHDTSVMHLTPANATIVEGGALSFSVTDTYGHSIAADWTLDRPACGSFTVASAAATSFISSEDGGGLTCTVSATSQGNEQQAIVHLLHDLSSGAIAPASGSVVEGGAIPFSATDAHGHPAVFTWSSSPGACGAFSTAEGASSIFAAFAAAGGLTCTVRATAGTLVLTASLGVAHSPPSTIEVAVGVLDEGGLAGASARVLDLAGHALDASGVTWTTDCAATSPTTGVQTTVRATQDAAGSTCHLTATLGSATTTVDIAVHHARPYSVTIGTPAAKASAGGAQALTLAIVDAKGNTLAPDTATWTSSCGAVAGAGASATFTAPTSAGTCRVTVTVTVEGASASGSTDIVVGASSVVPIVVGVGVVAAAAVVAGLLLMRRRKSA